MVSQIAPPSAQVLSEEPLVFVVPDLLTQDECNLYMRKVEELEAENRTMTRSNPPDVSIDASKLWPLPIMSLLAGVPPLIEGKSSLEMVLLPIGIALLVMSGLAVAAVPLVRLLSDSSSRTSDAMALNQDEDVPFIKDFVDRVSDVTGHSWEKWEAPVVTRYAPGAIFAKHGDASPTRGSEWADSGGQRVATCICYLNTVQEGGETAFDKLNIQVKPRKGSALVFFPADSATLEADGMTTHESLPPMEEKWIVQMFGRVGPRVPPPLGIPNTSLLDKL